jgi:transposase
MNKEQTYAGVDISKDYLDVTLVDSAKRWRFANNKAGIKKAIEVFKEMTPVMVVFEATGGLELSLVGAYSSWD